MKKIFLLVLFFFGLAGVADASVPYITSVKFKAGGDSPKVAVYFDQAVQGSSTPSVGPTDFTLSGASTTGITITSVTSTELRKVFVLTLSDNPNPSATDMWKVAASSSLRNNASETASTTAVDLFGNGDGTVPMLRGAFVYSTTSLNVMFSEEVNSVTAASTTNYSSLQTSATDSPGIAAAYIVPEGNFVIVGMTPSTTLGIGAGNSIDVANIQDIVGNAMVSTTATMLPAVKISEVKHGSTLNAQDEFVELYNFGSVSVAASTLRLHVRTAATDTLKTLTLLKTTIPEKGYYLIGSNSGYSGSAALDATYDAATNDIKSNSGVYVSITSTALVSSTSTLDQLVVDLIGMSTSSLSEGATTTALLLGESFERKALDVSTSGTMAAGGSDEFKGNSYDTHNNLVDFALRALPQPQNSLSQKEFPFGGPGASDTAAPQVMGSFPSGMVGEVVPTNLSYIGFGINESVQASTVSTSTVKLFAGADTGTNLCTTVNYSNFPIPGNPPGRCNITTTLSSAVTYTFRVLGDPTNSSTSTAVRDYAGNALNQPTGSNGSAGNYQITFTPQSGGGGLTFQAPPVNVMGTLPYSGAVNIPTNSQKIMIRFSSDVGTSTLNASTIAVRKFSDNSPVSVSSVSAIGSESRFSSDVAIVTMGANLVANTKYQISVSGVNDTSGRAVNSFTADFTTGSGVDSTGPSVVGKLPNITTGVPVNAVDIHVMTEDKLDPSTITTSTVKVKQGSNQLAGSVGFDPYTGEIIFFVSNVFQPSTSYTVTLNATGTAPCVANISGLCLLDTDGSADGLYTFSFTTGGGDSQGPSVLFANADQRTLSISFDEPLNELEAKTLDNYSLMVGGAASSLSSLAGHTVVYNSANRTVTIQNLSITTNASFTVTISNVHDLSGNAIGVQNSAQGVVADQSKTGGFVGPGGPAPTGGSGPQNFSTSTFGFVPQVEVRPFAPLAGIASKYFVGLPISSQVKSAGGGGKILLTFPSGFEVSGATYESQSPMATDVNGPGPGTQTVSGFTVDSTARTITITLSSNSRCDLGVATPCSGDAHDFLNFEIKGVVNSSIPKDASSGGYTVDVKIMNGTTVAESQTSKAFYLTAGGSGALVVNLGASGAASGTTTLRMFSPLTGPREAISTAFASGVATATFTGMTEGDYGVFTDPLITLGSTDYMGRSVPASVRVLGSGTTTVAINLTSSVGLTTVTTTIAAPAGKNIDVFANNADKFIVKTITTTGSDTVSLKVADGTWFVGVGPAMPKGFFEGPPPAPDFVMQPPVQVVVQSGLLKENSGTVNDGILAFTLGSASLTLSGTVVDAQGRAIVSGEVFAYSPLGGFGTHGSTDSSGKFSINVGAGTYQVGAFSPGMPPSGEVAVEVKSDGTMVMNGQTVSSVPLKLIKPERSISGKVLDQSNNPVSGAGVFAYCDGSVVGNACFGPGSHAGTMTGSDGSYTLYVKTGTWKVGAFVPGFGELPQVSKTVTTADMTDINFSPSTNTTFRSISGTVCKNDDASGNATICGSGDTKSSGVFIRAMSTSAGSANQTATNQSGVYTLKVPSANDYTIEAFDPALGKLAPLTSIDVSSGNLTDRDFVVGDPRTVTVNVKDSLGAFVRINQMFVDFFNYTGKFGNFVEIKNATSATINLPDGAYKVRASFPGKVLTNSDLAADSVDTTFATSTGNLTIDGSEAIKIVMPVLGTVAGTVYKGTVGSGNELADAFVSITNPSAGMFVSTQANASGTYLLKMPIGDYSAIAQKSGYLTTPMQISVTTSTATTTANLVVVEGSLAISGTVRVDSTAASRAFVRAMKLGGGFAGSQTDSTGVYTLTVSPGTWRVYAVAEGYAETENGSSPLLMSSGSVGSIDFNLTSKVTLGTPKVCQIAPVQGGECVDSDNGVRVVVPPGAFGSDTDAGSLVVKKTNILQQTASTKPIGDSFDFEFTDASGNKVSTFNSSVTLQFTQAKATFAASGITTKTRADALKVTLYSETIKDYDVLMTTVEYLDSNEALVANPSEDLSNVSQIRLKGLTTHFSGGGPGDGGDSLSPAAPAGVSGSGGAGVSAITVTWTTVTTNSDGTTLSDLSDYRVWRSTSETTGFAVIGTAVSSATSYTDSASALGTNYYYKMTARDSSGNESSQSTVSAGVSRSSANNSTGGGGGAPSYYYSPATTQATSTATTTTTTVQASSSTPVATSTASSSSLVVAPQREITAPSGIVKGTKVIKIVRRLMKGSTGEDVRQLQEFLALDTSVYPEGRVTGYYGELTVKAVRRFQEKYGIAKAGDPGYGDIGPMTRKKLAEVTAQETLSSELPKAENTEAQSGDVQVLQTKIAELTKQVQQLMALLQARLAAQ